MDTLLPPGKFGLPVWGETGAFIADPDFVQQRYEQYGPIFKSRILGRKAVFMVGPEATEFVLSSGMQHLSWREGWPLTFKQLLGRSLFLQEGTEHRRNRRLMMPAFHGPALARYIAIMEAIIQTYLAKWVELGEFVWYDELKQLTFDIASQIFLGTPPGPGSDRLSRLFTTLTNGLFGANYPQALNARRQLLRHLDQVIADRQQHPADDALSLLIQAVDENGDRLSVKEIRDQAMLLLFAGHETTTAMLTWLGLELGQHPAILHRAREEQAQLAAQSPELAIATLGQMPYLEQILYEVERLHPPVPGGFRGVIQPFTFNGYTIPKGWLLQYSILVTHRLPHVYRNPNQFDPDRFGPERQETKPQPFHLIGFGGGPRVCIGMAFAKLEMKLLLAHLLRGYRWEILPHQNLEAVLIPTHRPKDGLRVRFGPLT